MSITVRAVYEGGVLRPAQPLGLDEGEAVEVTVSPAKRDPRPLSDDEIARKLKAAESISEWVEATKLLPSNEDGYDILKALNDNRLWSKERPLIPDGVEPS
jgi:predicted DNA-binding antitoxin AbrB/MazE fold protein